MEGGPGYDDPDVEEAWCEERRREIVDYLEKQQLVHGRIGDWPAWHVAPVVSVWAIESSTTRGTMGWWVICGDLPTDYLSAGAAHDPREAIRAFADRWRSAAEDMRSGRASPLVNIGSTADERQSIAPMLMSRSKLLAEWAERDELWDDLLDED